MGLIQAIVGAASGVLADSWKEFFYCDAMSNDVLVVRGTKRIGGRSSNTKGNDNIITNGSGIAVADGQCMMIVDQGKIVEVCAQPGEYTWNASSEPSIFTGGLGEAIKNTFEQIGKRFTYGGDTGKDQRVYYFNIKEIMDNKFGTPNPFPFRVVDTKIGLDREVDLRCSGVYSYRMTDPLLFYTNVCGNVSNYFDRAQIDPQLKAEFVNALAPSFGKLTALELRPSQLASHYTEITAALNDTLSPEWAKKRGISIVSVALNPITLSEEDNAAIKQAQDASFYANPNMGAGLNAQAYAQAMKDAAKNEAGAMNGFIGMGMAVNQGNQAVAGMYQQAAAAGGLQPAPGYQPNPQFAQAAPAPAAAPAPEAPKAPETPAPAAPAANSWKCPTCGSENTGNFCPQCGTKKPEGPKSCSNCGYTPEEQEHLPNFCPQCGTKF